MTTPKQRRIILAPYQLSALADKRLAAVCVPAPITFYPERDVWRYVVMANKTTTVSVDSVDDCLAYAPLAPGDGLFVGEAWRSGVEWDTETPNEIDPLICSDVWYEADAGPPTGIVAQAWGKLRPASTMPAWAARHRLRVVSVAAKRVRDIAEDEAKACGCVAGDGRPENGMHTESPYPAAADFAGKWTARHGKKYPFETAWAWLVRVEVVK